MRMKHYTIKSKETMKIKCLNCFIFSVSPNGTRFNIVSTIGYQSDKVRSRITYLNGTKTDGIQVDYAVENSDDSYGWYSITNINSDHDANVYILGIAGFSTM